MEVISFERSCMRENTSANTAKIIFKFLFDILYFYNNGSQLGIYTLFDGLTDNTRTKTLGFFCSF